MTTIKAIVSFLGLIGVVVLISWAGSTRWKDVEK